MALWANAPQGIYLLLSAGPGRDHLPGIYLLLIPLGPSQGNYLLLLPLFMLLSSSLTLYLSTSESIPLFHFLVAINVQFWFFAPGLISDSIFFFLDSTLGCTSSMMDSLLAFL
jgi:hypothetical protein